MPNSLSNPSLVIKRGTRTPSIEVDNDEIVGKYASGAWEDLVAPFTAKWVRQKTFAKAATIWTWASPSVSFRHPGYSVFIAQFGLPMSYFEALHKHLAGELGDKVRFSDYVQPSLEDGWLPRVHIQEIEAWIPEDAFDWARVDA